MINADLVAELSRRLSAERLARYVTDSNGDQAHALVLYEWNVAIAEAFYGPLQNLEILLRNALGGSLRTAYGDLWFSLGQELSLYHPQSVMMEEALRKLAQRGVDAPTHGQVLAELNFGFWSGILGRRYENAFWRPLFRPCFAKGPPKLTRSTVHTAVDALRLFRNRIAHHEAIYSRNLSADYLTILQIAGWVSPVAASWLDGTNRVKEVLANRPTPP